MRALLCLGIVAFLCASLCVPARASLIGSSATVSYAFPTISSIDDVKGPETVGVNGAAFYTFTDNIHVYVFDDLISILSVPGSFGGLTNTDFNGFIIQFAGAPTITSAMPQGTNTSGNVSFTPDEVTVNLAGMGRFGIAEFITVDTATPVPEPSTISMFIVPLLALAALLWRGWFGDRRVAKWISAQSG